MVRDLFTIRAADASACGGKAAVLGELASRGYRVPEGVVLTTAVYEECLRRSGLAELVLARAGESAGAGPARLAEIEQEMAAAFGSADVPGEAARAVDAWAEARRVTSCAVRSSATNEDLPGATFAGQYSSFLNVSRSGLLDTIVRCWASLFTARAATYRRLRRIGTVGSMATIVQRMVGGGHAGVIFTRAPRRAEALLVECAPGPGDAVVSGTVAPNRYYVNRRTLAIDERLERHAIPLAEVREAARTALAIEGDLGGVQDVEYCAAGGGVYILQARPAAVERSRVASR